MFKRFFPAMSQMFLAAFTLAALVVITPTLASAQTIIRPGDKIQVTVFNHESLSTQVTVSSGGDVPLPLIRDREVNVGGLTQAQAAGRIEAAFSRYLRRPTVQVQILQQAQSIFFTGSVTGTQPYLPGETLASAISSFSHENAPDGGGILNAGAADLRSVRIQRDGKTLPAVDLEALARSGDAGPLLEPGDLILLATKPIRVDIRGDIKTPGTTYLSSGDTLAQAVAQAGGFSPTASLDAIVLRRNGVDRIVSSAGSEFTSPAHDGDVVTLPPAPHVSVIGIVEKPGETVLQTNATLINALYQAGGPGGYADLAHVKVIRAGQGQTYNLSHMARGDTSQNVPLRDGDVVFVPKGHGMNLGGFFEALGAMSAIKVLVH
jgi:protein involved in polysaccharide export with SLBB domain